MNRSNQEPKQTHHDDVMVVDDGADLHHDNGGSRLRDRQTHPDERRSVIGDLRLVEGQAGLDDQLGSRSDLSDYLRLVSAAAVELLDVAAVGCSLADRRGELQVVAWSSDEILDLERLELQRHQGPGVDCHGTGEPVVNVGRAEARRRWPAMSTKLAEAGFGSMHALPLRAGGHVSGVLTLYFVQRQELSAHDLSMGQALIQVAGIRLRQALASGRPDGDPRRPAERYQVGELIGHGGMAEVHLARDVDMDRVVAIKTPRADRISEPGLVERFRREGRTAAQLEHPSIVSVIGNGDGDGADAPRRGEVHHPYLVMEHVSGVTLRTLVGEGTGLQVDEALRITGDILSALRYTHEQGVVHGDLTTTNVMLSTDGDVKLMDFGSSHTITGSDRTTTQSSDVTPAYGSPERVQGRTSDTRADLYSVGCVLYELLTGRAPFEGDSPVDLAYRQVHEAPRPPSTHRRDIGPRLDAVVLRALSKVPEARYQSALEFRVDLLAAGFDASCSDVESFESGAS